LTFSWEKPGLRRVCLYSLEVPFDSRQEDLHMPSLPKRLERFWLGTPSLNEGPKYIVGWQFGPEGSYQKLEKNYARDITFHRAALQRGDLSHPRPRPQVLVAV